MDYEHSFVDAQGGYEEWGAAAVADFDGDGIPEFATGGRGGGFLHLYDHDGSWSRYEVSHEISVSVGAVPVDVDNDGNPELVFGEWGPEELRGSVSGKPKDDRYAVDRRRRLLWTPMNPSRPDFGTIHPVGSDLFAPHDLLAGDFDGDGDDEVVVREKDGPLRVYDVPEDPTTDWQYESLDEAHTGDGTDLADLDGDGDLDIITNQAWFRNDGTGSFERRRLPLPDDWDHETRTVAGDVDGDGMPEIVATESEVDTEARIVVLSHDGDGRNWSRDVVVPKSRDRRALHSLQIADLDGDGRNEIFSAEMENGKTDGQHTTPEWFVLSLTDGEWSEETIFDSNLGAHEAKVADFDDDGDLEIVGKIWHPNLPNGNGGVHHVNCLDPR
jgi:hypothetical protein